MRSRATRTTLTLLVWGAALGLAYGQSPLYTSNQNQYFLHGFAQAGIGNLGADWLANTRDPTPLFTALVRLMALSARAASLPLESPALWNYALHLLLFGVYLAGAFGIANRLYALRRSRSKALLFFGLLFATHAAALRYALSFVPGGEWAYLFDGGLGGQRLLGPVFQPSVFGVLLLLSVWLHLEQRPLPAMLLTVAAASFHPTYLLSAAILSAVYWVAMARRAADLRRPLIAAVFTLALVLPIVAYVYANFLPPSASAQRILIEFRIPDHAIPAEWFDLPAAFKLAWIAAALMLARKTRLLPVMLALLGVGGALTVWQIASGSDSLALLFPWRTSATLVPLATAVLAGRFASGLRATAHGTARGPAPTAAAARSAPSDNRPRIVRLSAADLGPRAARGIGLGLIVLSVLSGIGWSAVQFVQRQSMPERAMFGHVRRALAPGQQYLVPAKMQDFRLATGAPILADFKSIPYHGAEVLEWYQRVRLLDYFYRGRPAEVDCGLLEVFSGEYGVTHVVLEPDQRGLECERLELRYDDGSYSVHAIVGEAR